MVGRSEKHIFGRFSFLTAFSFDPSIWFLPSMRQLKVIQSITNRQGDTLARYLQDVSAMPRVTPEEEVILARKIKGGDEDALKSLVYANLRFVVTVAKQYQGQGVALTDLINEGNIGLLTAARRFDETRGFKFISFAVWWIRQSILQALAANSRLVRIPLNQVTNVSRVNRFYNQFVQDNERRPSSDEIGEALGIDPKIVTGVLLSSGRHVSMDAPLIEDEDNCLLDLLASGEETSADLPMKNESLTTEIDRVLASLPEREQQVIRMYFGIHTPTRNLEEIGEELQLSRERVRQLKEKALKILRTAQASSVLRGYL